MSKKRTIDAFFGAPKPNPVNKKPRGSSAVDGGDEIADVPTRHNKHATYPFAIPHLPGPISRELGFLPASVGRAVDDQPDLDLLSFEPYVPRPTAGALFAFLRAELPFYRVEYDIKRGGVATHIRTPRWTTVFGVDETSLFSPPSSSSSSSSSDSDSQDQTLIDARTRQKVAGDKAYAKYPPRPIPQCLDALRVSTEAATGCRFNFCLVNYYASGADSISFHSDDERFLGPQPAIASFSLGARRDFLMKHKPPPPPPGGTKDGTLASASATLKDSNTAKPLKLPLGSGDLILMRGSTQANWLHSIPKRSGKNERDGGRINITFRRAMVKGGTENYYNYNVGTGPVYKWDAADQEMKQWKP